MYLVGLDNHKKKKNSDQEIQYKLQKKIPNEKYLQIRQKSCNILGGVIGTTVKIHLKDKKNLTLTGKPSHRI